jgi:hypothetical protein
MKKYTFLLISAWGLINFSSCRKIWDYVKHGPGNATTTNCRVDQVSFWRIDEGTNLVFYDTAKVKYNIWGDPVSVKYTSGGVDRSVWHNMAFKYDNRRRLIAYMERASPAFDTASLWHTYYYTNDYTITDTIYLNAHGDFFGQEKPDIIPAGENQTIVWVEKYKLDIYGRIIKWEFAENSVTYTYNSDGNLVAPWITAYTDKISIKQTNKTWMFIAKDYSVNMEATLNGPTVFNSQKLPVGGGNDVDIFTFGSYYFPEGVTTREIKINYICP